MGGTLLVMAAVTYFGSSLSDRMDNYIQYVDAQDDLLVTQMPQADLDESGKIATADFYAWYGLDDLKLSMKSMQQ